MGSIRARGTQPLNLAAYTRYEPRAVILSARWKRQLSVEPPTSVYRANRKGLGKSCESPRKRDRARRRRTRSAINLAIDHIVNHLHEPLRLREISRVAMLSPFHFHRIFQAIIGSTPIDFVKRLRLEKALTLMAGTRTSSLTSIALACGFSSLSEFSRCFKRHYGVAPREFDLNGRRQAQNAELEAIVEQASKPPHINRLPPRHNPDGFRVKIWELPARTVAYKHPRGKWYGTGFRRWWLLNWKSEEGWISRCGP